MSAVHAILFVACAAVPAAVRGQASDTIDTSQLVGRGVAFETLGYGRSSIGTLISLGDVNGDGLDDLGIKKVEDTFGANPTYATFVVYGRAAGASRQVLDSNLRHATIIEHWLGLARLEDADGDGLSDFVLVHEHDIGGISEHASDGVVSVIKGSRDFPEGPVLLRDYLERFATRHFISSDARHRGIGRKVLPIGDVNGDGREDLAIVSSYRYETPEDPSGIIFILFEADGPEDLIDLAGVGDAVPGFLVEFGRRNHILSSIAPAGDVNGDGLDDILLGEDSGGADAVHLVYGRTEHPGGLRLRPWNDVEDLGVVIFYSPHTGVAFGPKAQTTALGDLDGDGRKGRNRVRLLRPLESLGG